MKTLLSFALCLCAIVTHAANPSTKSFRAAGGLSVTSNDITGIITYDGSGISSPTGGVSATVVSNIVLENGTKLAPGTGVSIATNVTASNTIYTVSYSGGTGMTISNANLLFVDMGGNNSTAKRGRRDLPFRDPRAAVAAAVAGDCVVVFPGLYVTNNIAKDGVNMYGYPGAILSYIDPGSGPGRGIIDDRDSGAVAMIIGGNFDFRYSTGLTGTLVGTIDITPNPTNVNNLRGAICFTNPASYFNMSCASIMVTTLVNTANIAAISVGNCSNVNIHCPLILDPIAGQQFYIGDDDAATPTFAASVMTGVWWELGLCDIVSERIQASGYAIYAIQPVSNAATQHLHVTANVIESFGTLHTVYCVGSTNSYKVWVTAQDIVDRIGNTGTIGLYGEGRFYITAQKISSPTVAILSATGNQRSWITTQRVGAKVRWVSQAGGYLDIICGDWDDDTGLLSGWDVSGGELVLNGGQARVLNGQGLVVRDTGKARFKDTYINTSAGNAMTNTPVIVGTNGVILHNVVLVAPAAAPAIMAVAAKNVISLNGFTANKTNHPNVTVLAGPYTVDSNVQ